METRQNDDIRAMVRDRYGAAAQSGCCTPKPGSGSACCGPGSAAHEHAKTLGYSEEELSSIPEAANLGLGCGNPTAIAGLSPGEVVLDLGSGAGMDAFLAAGQVGASGRVIGVDMTPEMLTRARETAAAKGVAGFVEFREGVIEALPVVSEQVDVVISNCVINLSPDKPQAFREAFRVLKPGGRLAVSDICLTSPLPDEVVGQANAYAGCVAGALQADDYLAAIEAAGFIDVKWTRTSADALVEMACEGPLASGEPELEASTREALMGTIWSYRIEAHKPPSDPRREP